jgi:transcriptional regulator of acetoin/glycerol metabolism
MSGRVDERLDTDRWCGPEPTVSLRPAIALSWKRSWMCGVDPETRVDRLGLFEVDPDAPLLVAARPVLRRMMDDLDGAPVAVLLAGRDGLVLDGLSPEGRGQLMDLARTRIGRQCTEELVGTNSIGTVLELGRGVQIRGEEHYLHSLRSLNCLGAPIEDPVSGRVEGVLSICGGHSDLSAGLAPFLSYAARDIRDRLRAEAPRRNLDLLGAFHSASRGGRSVVVIGSDLVLATPSATVLLEPVDHARLRELGAELGCAGTSRAEAFELASGKVVNLTLRRCGDAGAGGLLIEFGPLEAKPPKVPRGSNVRCSARETLAREVADARSGRRRTLITGERGTGRSTALHELAADGPVLHLDCSRAGRSPRRWAERCAEALAESAAGRGLEQQPLVALEGIEALPAGVALGVLETLAESDAWVAMTAPPSEDVDGEHAALTACCEVHLRLRPLRARTAELPAILREMTLSVADAAGRKPLRWTSEAVAALSAHPWPGNLHELRAVVRHVSRAAESGCATPETLPTSIARTPGRALSPLRRSEREIIAATLEACHGNKVHAATHLGISRTTLYRRMRELEIVVPS